ncbi:MAG: tyrosine-protein phosphatase [Oscillospiraceae bacterium]|nr:tyrosine-protein phosphatase [Oscillospiraceae bacterium]
MRILHLKREKNIRSFQGLTTPAGEAIKTNAILRSAFLANLTEKDAEYLYREHGIRTVIDLRTKNEILEHPDQLHPGMKLLNISLLDESVFGITHEEETDRLKGKKPGPPDMKELYRSLVTSDYSLSKIAEAMQAICQHAPEGGVLWHCTEGKDRCGTISALFLYLLGMDDATVMADYMETRKTNGKKARKIYWKIRLFEHNKELAQAVSRAFNVDEDYLNAALSAIREAYGSVDGFLTNRLGITETVRAQMKDLCLR